MSEARAEVGSAEARPVISFAGFSSRDESLLAAWAEFRAPLARSAAVRIAPADRIPDERVQSHRGSPPLSNKERMPVGFWRLVAANHRELGRSFVLYDDFSRAREHVARLQSVALTTMIVPGPRSGTRGWVLRHDDRPVLMCSRWHESHSACAASAEGARSALAVARVALSPEVRGRSGRVRRTVPDALHA